MVSRFDGLLYQYIYTNDDNTCCCYFGIDDANIVSIGYHIGPNAQFFTLTLIDNKLCGKRSDKFLPDDMKKIIIQTFKLQAFE